MRTYAQVNRRILTKNYESIRLAVGPGVEILAVVKGDAYGHGAVEVARTLTQAGATQFAVASVDEGVELRQAGIEGEVVLLCGVESGEEGCLRTHRLTPVIQTAEQLRNWEREALSTQTRLRCHLEFDTGMNRLGLEACCPDSIARLLSEAPHLEVAGLATHLASAEDFSSEQTVEQVERFRSLVGALKQQGIKARYVHLANSAAVAYRPETDADMVRPGLALFGYLNPAIGASPKTRFEVRPALEWKAKILSVREVPPGARVGYHGAYRAERAIRIGVVSVGYGDGFDRRMSNGGIVLLRGVRCPILGLVSMDITLVDVSAVPEAAPEEEVTLIGEGLDAWQMARHCGSIPYETLCGISKRVPRIYC